MYYPGIVVPFRAEARNSSFL